MAAVSPSAEPRTDPLSLDFTVDGRPVSVDDDGASLLEVLRDRLAVRSPKDGCSPQGQCGCCTVLVDGQPRVACVTPARRVAGRAVITVEALPDADRWADAFCAAGASQCGFCTPGIIVRLAALADRSRPKVEQALLAHLCRCTGWRTILDAVELYDSAGGERGRDWVAAARRAEVEGGVAQSVGPEIARGAGGFADDDAPLDALVAVPDSAGGWAVGETLTGARAAAGKVQGRRSTAALVYPIDVPAGDWDLTLRTTWVEPAYLEPDASWCAPGGEPVTPLANGGAFGGKASSEVGAVARELADEHGRPVRVLYAREDVVRLGPKRPPVAAGIRRDGTGVIRVARTAGIADAIARAAPGLTIEEVDVTGPDTSSVIRAAGWAEAAVLVAAVTHTPGEPVTVSHPGGGQATVTIASDGSVDIDVACGDPLDAVVLRSYCTGAAHMAMSWVRSEGLAVDESGTPQDLTVRSFGILRARDMPAVAVRITRDDGPPVNGSDAVFAACAAAAWIADGLPPHWPTRRT